MSPKRFAHIACVLVLCGCGASEPETSAVQATPQAPVNASNDAEPHADSTRHEAILAYEDAVRPLLDERCLAALPNRAWPTDPAELTCELANSSARLLPLIHHSGTLNLNWGRFERTQWALTDGVPEEKLKAIRFFQTLVQPYVDEDCSAPRPSTRQMERRLNWDWMCHAPARRVGYSAAFDQALESCAAAEELVTACAERRPADAALGALAASIEVAAYHCFFREGAGHEHGSDFGPDLVSESIAGLPE